MYVLQNIRDTYFVLKIVIYLAMFKYSTSAMEGEACSPVPIKKLYFQEARKIISCVQLRKIVNCGHLHT
jgi:hypothetical protein